MHIKTKDNLFKIIIITGIVLFIYIIFKYAFEAIFPFLFGFTVSMMVRKWVNFIRKATGLNLKIASAALLVLFYLIIFFLLFFIIRFAVYEFANLIENFPDYYNKIIAPAFSKILSELDIFNGTLLKIFNRMEQVILNLTASLSTKLASAAAKIALNIPELFVTVTVSIVASFFICIDYDRITEFFSVHLTKSKFNELIKVKETVFNSAWKMLGCYIIIFLLTFLELFVGLSLLGVRNSAALAITIALADILPLIGTGTILIPWAIISLLIDRAPLAVGLFTLYLIITIVRNIIEPKIIGKNIGLHPLLTLSSMYIGLKIGGIFWAVLLPILLMIIKILNDNGFFQMSSQNNKITKNFSIT